MRLVTSALEVARLESALFRQFPKLRLSVQHDRHNAFNADF